MNKHLLYLTIISFFMHSYTMHITHDITLNLDGTAYALPLQDVLNHVTRCQQVTSIQGNSKILGFHHYTYHTKEPYKTGTLCKINANLWVYTQDNPDEFHKGYVIYKGIAYNTPKTFFPCSWTLDNVKSYIQELITFHLTSNTPIAPVKTVGNKKFFNFLLKLTDTQQVPLRVVIEQRISDAVVKIITLYPEVKSDQLLESVLNAVLTTLADKQKTALTHTHRPADMQLSPELLQAITDNRHEQAQQLIHSCADSNDHDDQNRTALMLAAQNGNWNIIAALLEHNADIHTVDTKGNTALFYAVGSADIYSILALLDAQEINKPNNSGVTPLIHAITHNSLDTVDTLLAYGADPNRIDNAGFTPLMHTIRVSFQSDNNLDYYAHIIALLLSYKADPNIQHASTGSTVLMDAIHYIGDKAVRLVKLLLTAHADYQIKNNNQQTALTIAQNNRSTTILTLLQQCITRQQNWIHEHQSNELMYALHTDNTYKAKQLITAPEYAHTINAQDISGNTPLSLAIEKNNQGLIVQLLNAGADPSVMVNGHTLYDNVQNTLLPNSIKQLIAQKYEAAMAPKREQQQIEVEQRKRSATEELENKKRTLARFKQEVTTGCLSTELLEAIKPLKDIRLNDKQWTPFLYAVIAQKVRVVEQLLALNSNAQAKTSDGLDALMLAYQSQDNSLINCLLTSNCFTLQQVQQIWDKAVQDSCFTVLDTMSTTHPVIRQQALLAALAQSNTAQFDALVNAERVPLSDKELEICIFAIAPHPQPNYILTFLRLYPTAHACTNHLGQTPLMIAALADRVFNLMALYKNGASLDACDKQKRSVFEYELPPRIAALLKHINQKQIQQQQTLAKEQEIARLESQGYTPLMVAAYYDTLQKTDLQTHDITQTNNNGVTALMIAASRKSNNALQAILELQPTTIDQQDTNGFTALMHAIVANNSSAVEKLLACGAQSTLTNVQGQNCLHMAQAHKRTIDSRIIMLISQNMAQNIPKTIEQRAQEFIQKHNKHIVPHFTSLPEDELKMAIRRAYYLQKGRRLDSTVIEPGFSLQELCDHNRLTKEASKSFHGFKIAFFDDKNLVSLAGIEDAFNRKSLGLDTVASLDISNNRLTTLRDEDLKVIGRLRTIRGLVIDHNYVTTLPNKLWYLQTLDTLDLAHNNLTEIPVSINLMSNLLHLNVSHNRLKTLPESLWTIPNLNTLLLRNNKLRLLSNSMYTMENLVALDVSNNKLEALPEGICDLALLKSLLLNNNRLQKLPTHIDKLSQLTTLELRGNRFEMRPILLAKLPKLRKCDMTDNPCNDNSSSIFNINEKLPVAVNPEVMSYILRLKMTDPNLFDKHIAKALANANLTVEQMEAVKEFSDNFINNITQSKLGIELD